MASDLPVFLNRKSDRVKARLLRAASMAEMLGHERRAGAGGRQRRGGGGFCHGEAPGGGARPAPQGGLGLRSLKGLLRV